MAEWLGRLCIGSPAPNLLRHARPCADCGPLAAPSGVTKGGEGESAGGGVEWKLVVEVRRGAWAVGTHALDRI